MMSLTQRCWTPSIGEQPISWSQKIVVFTIVLEKRHLNWAGVSYSLPMPFNF